MRYRIPLLLALLTTLAACGDDPRPVQCDLQLTKSIDGDPVTSGPLTYNLVVDNVGDGACAAPITVTDDMPPGVDFQSTSSSNWNCSAATNTPDQVECVYQGSPLQPQTSLLLALETEVTQKACMASNCAEVANRGRRPGSGDRSTDNNRDCVHTQCQDADSCVDPPSGMVGWWTADQTADDDTSQHNHGTLQNGAHYTSGQVLEAFALDGADDHVEVPNDPSLNFAADQQFSIDAWIYPVEPKRRVATIIDKRTRQAAGNVGYALQLRGNKLIVRTQNGASGVTYVSSGTVPAHQWTHVTVTVDLADDQATLYLDGAQDGTFQPSSTGAGDLTNDAPLLIGQSNLADQPFEGRIDEVEIFDRLLDPDEVGSLVKAGPCGKCRFDCFNGDETYTAGADDGSSPATPSTYLQENFSPLEGFDDSTNNRHTAHTFADLKPTDEFQHICSATLELVMRPSGSIDYNDSLNLSVSDGNGNLVDRWSIRIGAAPSWASWTDSLRPFEWDGSNVSGWETFTFDLANLPASGSHPTNLMAAIDNNEMLNIRVQDDTEIDSATLTVDYSCQACDHATGGESDVAVDKHLEGELQTGQSSTYTISVINTGDADASGPTDVSDQIPRCMKIDGIQAPWDQWCTVSGQNVDCSYPDPIPAGSRAPDLQIDVTPTTECGDKVENCASISNDDDSDDSNNESCVSSVVSHQKRQSDLKIGKSHEGPLNRGAVNTYTIQVGNNGPATEPGAITVTDNLPRCLTFDSAGPSPWSCSSSGSSPNETVTCTHPGPLASGSALTLDLSVQHIAGDPDLSCGDRIRNCAVVQGTNPDPVSDNNRGCVQSAVK